LATYGVVHIWRSLRSRLEELSLERNRSVYNMQPLLVSSGLGEDDELDLRFTRVLCSNIDASANMGIDLLRVTAICRSASAGRRLTDP